VAITIVPGSINRPLPNRRDRSTCEMPQLLATAQSPSQIDAAGECARAAPAQATICSMQIWYRWFGSVLLAGVVYLVIGLSFAPLATPSVFFWRLAAWIVSAVVFASHIGYEHFRLRSSPRLAAWHVALGAAVGAFGLAAAANVRSLQAGSGNVRLLRIALLVWPTITGIPAFVIAFVVSALLARLPRHRSGMRGA